MTKGFWMTLPRLEALRILLFLNVLSGDVETGEKEFGDVGLWYPEPLVELPAWMLSLLAHDIRDRLSEGKDGMLPIFINTSNYHRTLFGRTRLILLHDGLEN